MKTSFVPSKHGWPFANSWPNDWITTKTEVFQLPVPVPIQVGFGLCGGMCWSALDRFHDRLSIPRNLGHPSTSSPLVAYIAQRQTDSVLGTSMWAKVLDWQRRPDTGHWNR